jgi:hypothetical protein
MAKNLKNKTKKLFFSATKKPISYSFALAIVFGLPLPLGFSAVALKSQNSLYKSQAGLFKESDSEFAIPDKDFLFNSFYELSNSCGKWTGETIEYYRAIKLFDSDKVVYYCDFNSTNGYAVFDDTNIYLFEPVGDLPLLQTLEYYEFSSNNGFITIVDGNYANVFDADDDIVDEMLQSPTPFNGQYRGGDGEIYDIQAYVSDKYNNYVLSDSQYLKQYTHINQFTTSVFVNEYRKSSDNSYVTSYSEGNWVINASYSLLYNLPRSRMNNYYQKQYNTPLLTASTPVDYRTTILADSQYPTYGTGTKTGTDTYIDSNGNSVSVKTKWTTNDLYYLSQIPIGYLSLRTTAIAKSYKPEWNAVFSYKNHA